MNKKDRGEFKGKDTDPLIASLGALESGVTDIGEHHDEYIRAALLAELWRNEDE
ncbi:MAG: hypothetical protein OXU36_13795 [Candidatus Poribacteria bacterium]|nr:hypothetical protein [Candidatus Poribacteria bacterium]